MEQSLPQPVAYTSAAGLNNWMIAKFKTFTQWWTAKCSCVVAPGRWNSAVATSGFSSLSRCRFASQLESGDEVNIQVRRLSSMRQGRNFPALAALNGKIFAMGGRAPESTVDRLGSVEVYEVETNQWRMGRPLVTPDFASFL